MRLSALSGIIDGQPTEAYDQDTVFQVTGVTATPSITRAWQSSQFKLDLRVVPAGVIGQNFVYRTMDAVCRLCCTRCYSPRVHSVAYALRADLPHRISHRHQHSSGYPTPCGILSVRSPVYLHFVCTSSEAVLLHSVTPELPLGLVFDNSTGFISGTPSVRSTLTGYTIEAVAGETVVGSVVVRIEVKNGE